MVTTGLLVTLTVILTPVLYVLTKAVHWIIEWRRIAVHIEKVPGSKTHWWYGNIHQHPGFNEKYLTWTVEQSALFPRIAKFWNGPFKGMVAVSHPDTAKIVLRSSEPKPVAIGGDYWFLLPWLGEGLLTSGGPKWLRNRKLLTPAFHFEILKPYVKVYNAAAEKLLCKWEEECTSGKSVEIYQPVSLCTLDIILKCAFSFDQDVQSLGENHPYVCAVLALSELILDRIMHPLMYVNFLYYLTSNGRRFQKLCNYTHQFSSGIIAKRKKTLADDPGAVHKRYLDFLDILLSARDEDGQGLSDVEIRQEVDTFLFEGHDTTASALSWALFSLAQHPNIQDRVRQEVDGILSSRDNPEVQWEDLNKMPYLTMCLKEAIRMHSPVPIIGRELTKQTEIDGYTILPGTMVNILIYTLHHNSKVWGEDHMDFKPERFHPDNTINMDPYAFVPFSSGPRNCIGQNFAMNEEKVLIARILHRFTLSLDPERPARHCPQMVMRAEDGIWLNMTPRV